MAPHPPKGGFGKRCFKFYLLFHFSFSFLPPHFGEGWGGAAGERLLKKTAHRDSMSRFPILGNGIFSLHGCKKLLCHHQKLLFNFIHSFN
jgi:hypothetical protein